MQHGQQPQAESTRLSRRLALRLPLLAALATVRPLRAQTTVESSVPPPFQERPELIVAGPADGALSRYSGAIAAGLNRRLPSTQAVHQRNVGGADGVTAANQFEANALPDGHAVLMVPGAAAMAWLRGEQRAQFDIGHWLPVLTSLVSGLVLVGAPNHLRKDTLLAVEGDAALALPAVLGLDLVGVPRIRTVLVDDAVAALQRQEVDLAFLRGDTVPERRRQAEAAGAVPLFSLGLPDTEGHLQRDPFQPDVPTLPELLASRPQFGVSPELIAAWHAVAAASRLEMALLLPWLTPANTVFWWRGACGEIALPNQTHSELGAAGSRMWRSDPTGNFGLTPLVIESGISLALHRWMIDQLG